MKEAFVHKDFREKSLELLAVVDSVLREYARMGYDLSLRQLYYQMVARGHLDNTQRNYSNLGSLVTDARLAGMIDWDMISDRGRRTVWGSHWESPSAVIRAAAEQFRIDKWADQPYHIEVMVEKQALEGVLIPVCSKLDVRFTANKGYSSASMMYEVGLRLRKKRSDRKSLVVIYLGDHDPSGIDMTRDVGDRLQMFSGADIDVERVALNMDQVRRLNPPKNPAKETDSRYSGYREAFGDSSWELDAIDPDQLAEIVQGAVVTYRDQELWDEAVRYELEQRERLDGIAAELEEEAELEDNDVKP